MRYLILTIILLSGFNASAVLTYDRKKCSTPTIITYYESLRLHKYTVYRLENHSTISNLVACFSEKSKKVAHAYLAMIGFVQNIKCGTLYKLAPADVNKPWPKYDSDHFMIEIYALYLLQKTQITCPELKA